MIGHVEFPNYSKIALSAVSLFLLLSGPSQAVGPAKAVDADLKNDVAHIIDVAAPKIVPVAKGARKYFQPHVYVGGRFSRRMAAEVGYPDAVVFDRRSVRGDVYQCSFITYRSKKAIVCD